MVTSDFRPEVEIRPFRACAMKNMKQNPYLWPNRRNFRVIKEIGVEEHNGDIKFFTGSGNTAISRMHSVKNMHYSPYLWPIAKIFVEVEIWPYRACAMHPAIIIGTVRSLWT